MSGRHQGPLAGDHCGVRAAGGSGRIERELQARLRREVLPAIPTCDLYLRNRYNDCGEAARYDLSPSLLYPW
jgi:hypothetical protein